MGAPFKMTPKTPLMKALVGKQGNLPEHLKKAILDAPAKKTDKTKGKDPRYKYNEEGRQVAIKDRTSGGDYQLSTKGKKAAVERTGTFDPKAGRNKPFAGTYIDTEGMPTTDSSKAKGFKDESGKYQQFSTSRSEKAKQIAGFDRKKRLHEASRTRMEDLRKTQAEYKGTTKQAGKSPTKMYGKKKK